MKLYCMVDGCPNFVETKESLAPDARFTCKEHNPSGPDDVHFQDDQFSRDLNRGTTYIDHQSIEFRDMMLGIYGSNFRVITQPPNIDGPGDDDPIDHDGEDV